MIEHLGSIEILNKVRNKVNRDTIKKRETEDGI